jgi:hypothetical protein
MTGLPSVPAKPQGLPLRWRWVCTRRKQRRRVAGTRIQSRPFPAWHQPAIRRHQGRDRRCQLAGAGYRRVAYRLWLAAGPSGAGLGLGPPRTFPAQRVEAWGVGKLVVFDGAPDGRRYRGVLVVG